MFNCSLIAKIHSSNLRSRISLFSSSLSANNPTDIPYHTIEENSIPPTLNRYYYQLRSFNQTFIFPRQDLRYHIFPVHRLNSSLQKSTITLDRVLTRLTHTSTEQNFEVTVKFVGLNRHPTPTSTQT